MLSLNRALKLGDAGEDVAFLYEYLQQTGYIAPRVAHSPFDTIIAGVASPIEYLLPTDAATRNKQFWELPNPLRRDEYDGAMQQAVTTFQHTYGLPETGEVDAVTLELIQTPRCGIADVHGITIDLLTIHPYFVTKCAWTREHLRYHVAETLPGIPITKVQALFANMAKTWAELAHISLESGTFGSELQFFNYNGDGAGHVLAYTYYPCSGKQSGNGYYDARDTWSAVDNVPHNRTDLASVILHELGHAFGLGHSRVAQAVMYPYIGRGVAKREPTPDDRQGIHALYGA